MFFHTIVGVLIWAGVTAALRLWGDVILTTDDIRNALVALGGAAMLWFLAWSYFTVLRIAPERRIKVAAALVIPGMILDAAVVSHFGIVFPNMDTSLDKTFGAILLFHYAIVLLAGFFYRGFPQGQDR
jgi:hypothetical protein